MWTWLKWVAGGLLLLLVVGWFNRSLVFWFVLAPIMLAPDQDFNGADLVALNYSDEMSWAALPWRADDVSDAMPDGNTPVAASIQADVFYVHPTSAMKAGDWNMTLDQDRSSDLLLNRILPGQPSAFDACCRVFAPYYRQATFFAFMMQGGEDGDRAIDVAYEDVRDAFRYYIANWWDQGPLIIAGHSQGSAHAIRLVQEEILGTPLESYLVAAYVPGWRLPVSTSISTCASDDDTGCALSWNSVRQGAQAPLGFDRGPVLHNGVITRTYQGELTCNPPRADTVDGYTGYLVGMGLAPSIADAACEGGFWRVAEPELEGFHEYELAPGWYHVYEYAYVWVALGQDAVRRIDAWAARNE